MTFNNYKIPEEVTESEEFIYSLVEKMYCIGSNHGFVMGDFLHLIRSMKEQNISKGLIEKAEKVYKSVDTLLCEYGDECYQMVSDEWKRLGKPLSMAAHVAKKKRLDAEDDYKAEYYDR